MRSKDNQELFRYWNSLRGDNSAPSRQDFSPAAIARILRSVFLVKTVAGIPTFGLAGGNICNFYGQELRHKAFSLIWLSGVERKPNSIALKCAEQQIPHIIEADGLAHTGLVSKLEMIMLPMVSASGERNRIIGALSELRKDASPSRSGLVGLSPTNIRAFDPDTFPVNFVSTKQRVTAFPKFKRPEPHRKVGHLYVIDGGRKN